MKKTLLLGGAILLFGCAELPNFLIDLPLIGGELGDFRQLGDAEWELEDGVISPIRGESNGYIYTKEIYTDFDMTFEVFIEASTNSGVYVRCDLEVINPSECYEFNIWDEHEIPANRTGSIVGIAPPSMSVSTIGKWNSMRVRLENDHLQVWVNGNNTNDLRDEKFASGIIALQYGGSNGMVRFRNIQISKL